jgi:hypothetical protein
MELIDKKTDADYTVFACSDCCLLPYCGHCDRRVTSRSLPQAIMRSLPYYHRIHHLPYICLHLPCCQQVLHIRPTCTTCPTVATATSVHQSHVHYCLYLPYCCHTLAYCNHCQSFALLSLLCPTLYTCHHQTYNHTLDTYNNSNGQVANSASQGGANFTAVPPLRCMLDQPLRT